MNVDALWTVLFTNYRLKASLQTNHNRVARLDKVLRADRRLFLEKGCYGAGTKMWNCLGIQISPLHA